MRPVMIERFDARRGYQCPRCGKGKMKEYPQGRYCPLCAFHETFTKPEEGKPRAEDRVASA